MILKNIQLVKAIIISYLINLSGSYMYWLLTYSTYSYLRVHVCTCILSKTWTSTYILYMYMYVTIAISLTRAWAEGYSSLFVCVCLSCTFFQIFYSKRMLVEGLPANLISVYCFVCETFSLWCNIEKRLFLAFLCCSHFEMFYSHAHVNWHVLCLQTCCFNSECEDHLCSTGDSNWLWCDFTKVNCC